MKGLSVFGRLLATSALALALAACATVPGTGRRQLSMVSDSQLNAMAAQQYTKLVQKGPLSKNQRDTALVRTVGQRIAKAAEQFLRENGLASEIPSYKWEFNLIDSKEVNAFCMPGGKVAFYTGILPVAKGEEGVATVMGHEVAHAIAHHSREQSSQNALAQLGGAALSIGLGAAGVSSAAGDLAMQAYGAGAQVGVLLPFSRAHESEADRIGLTLMALAGYNPAAAVPFWQRMSGGKSGGGSDFLSTHPSDAKRVADIEKYLPEAQARYKKR